MPSDIRQVHRYSGTPLMRSIISAIAATLRQSTYNLVMDSRDAFNRHFSLSFAQPMPGFFIKVPFLPLSAWVEWGQPHARFGTERSSARSLEFFLGTVRGVFSIETKVERNEA
jgi:hypothetical protein